MRNEADWRRWFESYAAYILPYARDAQAAGADMFCVGREMDSTVVRREADWRALVVPDPGRVRGPAHLLGQLRHLAGDRVLGRPRLHRRLGVLPALRPARLPRSPSSRRAGTGRSRRSRPASRRWGRPVLLTEAGFPSIPSAAKAPWREERRPGRRVAPGPLLRGDPARPRPPALDRGRLVLALGALVAAALPRPLPRHRRQAGRPSRWRGGTPLRHRNRARRRRGGPYLGPPKNRSEANHTRATDAPTSVPATLGGAAPEAEGALRVPRPESGAGARGSSTSRRSR